MAAPTLDTPRVATPEEFLAMEDAVAYEMLEDGTLVERCMSQESDEIASNLVRLLGNVVVAARLGSVFGPVALRIFPTRPRRIPRADVVFISNERRAQQADQRRGPLTVAPELVAEVVSTWDNAEYLDVKVQEYLDAGVRLVWVIYPESRHAMVFRTDGSVERLGAEDVLSGEDIVPGFKQPLADLLPAWEATEPGV